MGFLKDGMKILKTLMWPTTRQPTLQQCQVSRVFAFKQHLKRYNYKRLRRDSQSRPDNGTKTWIAYKRNKY